MEKHHNESIVNFNDEETQRIEYYIGDGVEETRSNAYILRMSPSQLLKI